LPANTRIVGDGSQGDQQTVLQIADTGNFQAFLWIRNVSNVSLQHLRLEGTSYESGCTQHDYGRAIGVWSDPGAGPPMTGIEISDDVFHDFNGQSWVAVNAEDGSPGIGVNGALTISGNVFVSDANLRGGCAASGGLGYPVQMISLHGSNLSAQGLVANVAVTSNTFDAGYVKSALAIWSGTQRISVAGNLIRDSGLGLPVIPATDLGRYAIIIYNSAHAGPTQLPGLHPDTIWVTHNTITNPYSCGVYVAAARNLAITDNYISGQRDPYDVTLPKGAIALNHVENVSALEGNELTDNHIGISSVGSTISMGDNEIAVPPGGVRTRISP
jgi:hypothetical protein